MKRKIDIAICSFVFAFFFDNAQIKIFSNHHKFGVKENETVLIPAIYDTIVHYDEKRKLCLACDRHMSSNNRIIRTSAHNFHCNYLNRSGQRLIIKTDHGDTCSVFTFGKTTVKQFTDNPLGFVVATPHHHKYLIDKDFNQLTFHGYHDVNFSVARGYYNIHFMDANENIFAGLIDSTEKNVVPHEYSMVHINPVDSLITGCRSGFAPGSLDDVLDYKGKLVGFHHYHVEIPTKNFVVYKLFEPHVHYVVHNISSKAEYKLKADEIYFYEQDQLLINYHDKWYIHDLKTNTRKEKQM